MLFEIFIVANNDIEISTSTLTQVTDVPSARGGLALTALATIKIGSLTEGLTISRPTIVVHALRTREPR